MFIFAMSWNENIIWQFVEISFSAIRQISSILEAIWQNFILDLLSALCTVVVLAFVQLRDIN